MPEFDAKSAWALAQALDVFEPLQNYEAFREPLLKVPISARPSQPIKV
jgi:hypothetical protein